MPEAFERCVRDGGRVRTKTLKGNRYMPICFEDGKSHAGYAKKRKAKGKKTGSRTRGKHAY